MNREELEAVRIIMELNVEGKKYKMKTKKDMVDTIK